MWRPLALCIGLRYTRAKRRSRFVSFISLISILGIALGVIVLITILSVLNGFDREIKKQVFGMISPITITSPYKEVKDWALIEKSIKTDLPNITSVAPFVSGQAMLTNSRVTEPTVLLGISPTAESKISVLDKKMVQGALNDLKPGSTNIIIGKDLAKKLEVVVGDQLTLATIKGNFTATNLVPKFKKFTVSGIFSAGGGGLGFDSKMAYINIKDAQKLFDMNTSFSGLHLNINDIYQAPSLSMQLQATLPNVQVWNWTDQLGDFFDNLRLTKTMMFFIFVLIIAVAVFNLISTMVMVVKSKEADIAILRTLGATPGMILSIFVVQGTVIGLVGTLIGVLGGVLLATYITPLSIWIQSALHTQLMSSDVYFVNYLPAQLDMHDVLIVSLIAIALSFLATLYPSINAARIEPVEALRYE